MARFQSSPSIQHSETRTGRRVITLGALLLLAFTGTASTAAAAPCLPGKDGADCTSPVRHIPPLSAAQPSPGQSIAAITVKAQLGTYHLHVPHIYDLAFPRLMLHITGTHFRPSSQVSIAVVNTASWQMLFTGSVIAQGAVLRLCYQRHSGCTEPNPQAGTIASDIRLNDPPTVSNLEVLFRSGQYTGLQRVIVQ